MSQSHFGVESVVDSEELMSWLLLNPDMDFENFSHYVPAEYQQQQQQPSQTLPVPSATHQSGYQLFPTNLESTHVPFPAKSTSEDYMSNAALSSLPQNVSSYSLNSMDGNDYTIGLASSDSRHASKKSKKSSSTSSITGAGKKRPRESIEDLEARVKELRAENADLQAHLLNVTQRTTEVQKQRISMERLMTTKLAEVDNSSNSDQSELNQIVQQYTDIYADYGRCRQREVAFHLQQLEKLIVPTLTTKMSLWALQQDRNFFQRNKSPMFDLLCKELEITGEQTEKILERRERVKYLLDQLSESLELLQSLKEAIEKKHASYDKVCGRVQDAANPKQTVKFLMWITRNAESLAKFIPGFNRSVHHTPNVEFVEKIDPVSVLQEPLTTTVGAQVNAPLPKLPHNIHRF